MKIYKDIPEEIDVDKKYIIYGINRNIWMDSVILAVLSFEDNFAVEHIRITGIPSQHAISELITTGESTECFRKCKHMNGITYPFYNQEGKVEIYPKSRVKYILSNYERRCKNSKGVGEFVIIETDDLKDIRKYLMLKELCT